MEVAQHPYKTQILDFHSCKTQWATRSLYFEGQKRNQFCILHYRLNLELLLKDAAKKLTGFKKRAFMAQVTIDYFNSSPRRAETELGWSRQAIATGLKELETGIICVDNYRARGRKKTEELL
ncbi:hypothetical protein M8120_14615 [Microcystis aeruginosa str. Chao 1910]|uniref:hypothetical protein n=1 Tax=Microcystis aeruginosa TaxID=1126 RepID=UPI002246C8FD|nr:hypothetical protein [Microcystis aeruginosa]UZO74150.1 hypothetical protein M8120_14615 [Microcystis aeruginosa str. Chao 1910]